MQNGRVCGRPVFSLPLSVGDERHLERNVFPPMAEPETPALDLTCAECGRKPLRGEVWRVYFTVVVGEVFVFCPEFAEREFGE
jgi:hypothetical protein